LLEYGRIVESGFGDDPPANVKARLRDEYGYEG
jgi:hypothetical protein